MKDLKKPMDYASQVEILGRHGLRINNTVVAEKFLEQVNYYRLSGYLVPYRENPNQSMLNKDLNPVFENIVAEYEFDREVRGFLLKYLETIEVYFRSLIANEWSMGMCADPPHDQHYDFERYSNKKRATKIIRIARNKAHGPADKDIVQHQINKYDKLHTWVVVELLSFSQLSKLFEALPKEIKKSIAKKFEMPAIHIERRLHFLSVLRNRCAHAGRLYKTSIITRKNDESYFKRRILKTYPSLKQDYLFAYIVSMTALLPTLEHKRSFISDFKKLVEKHKERVAMDGIGLVDNYYTILCNLSKSRAELIDDLDAVESENRKLKEQIEEDTQKSKEQRDERIKHWDNEIKRLSKIVASFSLPLFIGIFYVIDRVFSLLKSNPELPGWIYYVIPCVLWYVGNRLYDHAPSFLKKIPHKIAKAFVNKRIPKEDRELLESMKD